MKRFTIWEKETGKPHQCKGVDLRELIDSGAYTETKPAGAKDPEKEEIPENPIKNHAGLEDFAGYTNKQLQEFAKQAGIKNFGKMSKVEMINALTAANFKPDFEGVDSDA